MNTVELAAIIAVTKREVENRIAENGAVKGDQGLQGIQGPQGPKGIQGDRGPQGDVGPQGVAGPQGIQGDVGPRGADGVTGPQGVAGRDGKDGATPAPAVSVRDVYVDPDDGDLYVELTNSRLINAGHVKGKDGKDGKPGKAGRSGVIVGGGGGGSSGSGGASLPVGGTTGQALAKASDADGDVSWQTINSATWGGITGTLSAQTDLQTELNGKATTAQGALADTALQSDDIGVSVQGYSAVLAGTTASFTTADESKLDSLVLPLSTTSLTPQAYQGAAFVSARADLDVNLASLVLMSDGTRVESGKVTWTAHGLTVGAYYFLSQSTAGAYTSTMPTSGLIQRLWFVENANTIHVDVEPVENAVVSSFGQGVVLVDNQVFSTSTFVDSTNGVFAIPSAGTWRLRYDLMTDGTGGNSISMFAITDPSNNVIAGTERTRGGGVTTSQTLTAECSVVTTGPANYKLRGRDGGGTSATILNGGVSQSTISWTQMGGGGGATVWGTITGTLSSQTDLQTALDGKQPLSAILTATTASFTTADETKLDGIAAGATVNSPDATLLARANHTGTQAISTVTGLQTALDGKATAAQGALADTASQPGHTHAQSDVTGLVAALAGKLGVADEAATVATIAGRVVAGANVTVSGAGTAASPYSISSTGGGGGGGTNAGSSIMDFGTAPGTNIATIAITGQSAILSGSKIKVWFQAAAGTDYNSYEHGLILPQFVSLTAGDIIPATGFTIYAVTKLRINGNIICHWEWS